MKKLATALIAGLVVATLAAPASASASSRVVNVVSLGDSYASGIGAGDYLGGTGIPGGCWRSANSYSALLVAELQATGVRVAATNVTCSGATIQDLRQPFRGQPAQLDSLNRNTDVVSLTVGANDIGLAGFGGLCIQSECSDAAADATLAKLDPMGAKLRELLKEIKTRSPHAKVVVTGYGRQITTGDNAAGVTLDPICGPGVITGTERTTAERITVGLDSRLRSATAGIGTYVSEFAEPGVLRPEFAGHSLCEAKAPYYRGFDALAPGQEGQEAILHLNKGGHAALAAVIKKQLLCR
jgi:lysophospholipase L1-like esterase